MKRKWSLWFWLAAVSAGLGILLAAFMPLHGGGLENADFEPSQILLRFFIFFPLCFIAFVLLAFIFKLCRRLFRWFFSWRVLKWCLLALGILLALIPLFYAEEDWRGKHAWKKYKHAQEAKGEQFDFASFIPPPVPDERNFALAPIVVSSYARCLDASGHPLKPENTNVVNRLDLNLYRSQNFLINSNVQLLGWQTGKRTDLKAWQAYYCTMFVTNRYPAGMRMPPPFLGEPPSPSATNFVNLEDTNEVIEVEALATNEFPVAAQPQSPAADVLLALSKFNPVLEDLRQAAHRPQSRFPLGYDAVFSSEILIPHYGGLKNCVSVLSLRASAELAAEPPAALADIKLMLRLTESVRNEPFYYAQSTRVGWFNFAMQPIWEGVVQRKWTAGQLAELDTALAQLDFLADYVAGTRAQCAADVRAVEWCRLRSNKDIFDYNGYDSEEFNLERWLNELPFRLFPAGWYALGKKVVCQSYVEGVLPTADLQQRILSPEKYAVSMRPVYAVLNSRKPWNFWTHFFFGAIQPSRFAQAQTEVDLARLAIAW